MKWLAGALALGLWASPALAGVTEDLAAGKIPLYPGAKPHAHKVATGLGAIATVQADLPKVLGYYRRELSRRGWQAEVSDELLNQELDRVPLAVLQYRQGVRSVRIVLASEAPHRTTIWVGDVVTSPREMSHGQPAR